MNYKHLLFIIFSLVIVLFVLWNSKPKLTEPLENLDDKSKNTCCGNDPLFLAIKNSGEISVLKEQVNEINNLKQKISTLEMETKTNTKYLEDLQKQYAEEATAVQTSMESPDENEVQSEMSETTFSPQEEGPTLGTLQESIQGPIQETAQD